MKNQKKMYVTVDGERRELSEGGSFVNMCGILFEIITDCYNDSYIWVEGKKYYIHPYHPKAGKPKKDKEERKVKVNLSLPEYKYKKLTELYPGKLNAMLEVWADDMIYNEGGKDGN